MKNKLRQLVLPKTTYTADDAVADIYTVVERLVELGGPDSPPMKDGAVHEILDRVAKWCSARRVNRPHQTGASDDAAGTTFDEEIPF